MFPETLSWTPPELLLTNLLSASNTCMTKFSIDNRDEAICPLYTLEGRGRGREGKENGIKESPMTFIFLRGDLMYPGCL